LSSRHRSRSRRDESGMKQMPLGGSWSPCTNYEQYIGEASRVVLTNYSNWEIVVVNKLQHRPLRRHREQYCAEGILIAFNTTRSSSTSIGITTSRVASRSDSAYCKMCAPTNGCSPVPGADGRGGSAHSHIGIVAGRFGSNRRTRVLENYSSMRRNHPESFS